MAKCVRCSAELIGSAKFCASCGAPVAEPRVEPAPATVPGSPPAPSTPNAQISVVGPSAAAGFEPVSQVNPFAATASPNSAVSRPSGPGFPAPGSSSSVASAAGLDPASDARGRAAAPSQPGEGSQVSPLAVSNAVSQPGSAFREAVVQAVAARDQQLAARREASIGASSAEPAKKPGTQMMPGAPSRAVPAAAPPPPQVAASKPEENAAPTKTPARTVAMGFNAAQLMMKGAAQPTGSAGTGAPTPAAGGTSGAPSKSTPPARAPSTPGASVPQGGAPSGVPQSVAHAMPQSAIQPSGAQPHAPQSAIQPQGSAQAQPGMNNNNPMSAVNPNAAHPYGAAQPYAAPAAQPGYPAQGAWGWNAAQPQPQPPPPAQGYPPPSPYGFGYAPGARVHVTWSNGQRYPATVTQVTGTQCLVAFPDGQQHWVEMQYLLPG